LVPQIPCAHTHPHTETHTHTHTYAASDFIFCPCNALHWTDNKCGHFASECRYKSVRTNDRNSAVHDTVANVVIGAYSFMGEVSYHTVQDKNVWYADNGATDHMTFDDSLFVTYTKFAEPKPVRVGNNAVILAYGCDRVNVEMYVDEKWTKSFLSDVLYMYQTTE